MWSVHVGTGDGDWLEMARLFHHCLHFLIWAMSVPLFSLARWLYAVFFPFLSLTLFPSVPPPSALFPPRSFSRRRRPPPDARRPTPDASHTIVQGPPQRHRRHVSATEAATIRYRQLPFTSQPVTPSTEPVFQWIATSHRGCFLSDTLHRLLLQRPFSCERFSTR